jgi:hypothetical protein
MSAPGARARVISEVAWRPRGSQDSVRTQEAWDGGRCGDRRRSWRQRRGPSRRSKDAATRDAAVVQGVIHESIVRR